MVSGGAGSVAPPTAQAGWLEVLRNCSANGQLGKAFSRGDLQRALERLPADLAEYSDCDEQIADVLRGMDRADRLSAAARRRAGKATSGGEGRDDGTVDGRDGGGVGGSTGPRVGSAESPRVDSAASGKPDQGVGGALLSGAEAVGSAPLDVVEAAAEGRLGLPGFAWAALGAIALLGAGIAREYRAGSR